MDLGLYVITSSVPELGRDHYDVAEAAIKGGATAIQLRVKKRQMGDVLKMAIAIHEITQEAGIPLIINDYVGIALAARVEGLHIGPDDISISAARQMLGPEAIIGMSVSRHDDALKAEKQGASYLGVGAIYKTATKPGKEPLGPARIAKIKKVVSLPVVAIGGITAANLETCIEAGADGVAVITAISLAEDMVAATAELKAMLIRAQEKKRIQQGMTAA